MIQFWSSLSSLSPSYEYPANPFSPPLLSSLPISAAPRFFCLPFSSSSLLLSSQRRQLRRSLSRSLIFKSLRELR
ncbi:hypothetical protein L6164_005310 [Bauhinia variegata]|uniref:Uncharacterized protein n=1 Tax=Bauhinia variegata TaxID=167791 RepID=A0ACB9PQW1_BAUVA|nr:hypothetical protein L6164_005310 [Bauhinia variegata]